MDDYGQFVAQVYRKTGINLADYKEAQMKRRLTSFRDREQYASFHDMLEAFNRDPTLLERFLNRITINVSEFFRNSERWQSLQKEVLPVLASNRAHLKCWSAACSTGEEPYTLAMILKEMGIPSNCGPRILTGLCWNGRKQASTVPRRCGMCLAIFGNSTLSLWRITVFV